MVTANTLTTLDGVMKELYPSDKVVNLALGENPILQIMQKRTNVGGDVVRVGLFGGPGGGGSASISNTLTNSAEAKVTAFLVTLNEHFEAITFNRRAVKQCMNNGSLIDLVKDTVNAKLATAADAIAAKMSNDGTGVCGRISSSSDVTSATITLADKDKVVAFEVGDVVVLSADASTARSGTNTITGVDYSAGTLTTTTSWDTGVAAAAASDWIAIQGDLGSVPKGISAFLPTTAPSSGESFLGIDRSTNSRYYGVIVDGTGMHLQGAINKGLAKVHRQGGSPDVIRMSPQHFVRLVDETGAQVQYSNSNADIGFSYINFLSPGKKPAKVITDRWVDGDRIELLDMKTWFLYSAGQVPELQDDGDGNAKYLRSSSADQFEARISAYFAVACNAPGHNGVVTVDAEDL